MRSTWIHCAGKMRGFTVSVIVSGLTAGCKLRLWLQAPVDSVHGQRLSDLCLTEGTGAVRYLSVSHSIAFVSHGQWDRPQAYTVSPSSAGALNLIQNLSFCFKGSWGWPVISALQLSVCLSFVSFTENKRCFLWVWIQTSLVSWSRLTTL